VSTTANTSDAFTLEELRAIFKLHTDTVSQTHDILGCSCCLKKKGLDDVDDDDENTTGTTTTPQDDEEEAEEDDDLPDLATAAFVSAAKIRDDQSVVKVSN
jgi:hypothetical protein